MNRHVAPFAVLGIFGCASAPANRWDIGPVPEREPSYALLPSDAPAEAAPSAGIVSTAEGILAETPAAGFDSDPAWNPDAIDQGGYPPPQGTYPPPQGTYPPPPGTYPPPPGAYAPQPRFERTRFTLKGGYYSVDDTKRLDDGSILEGTFMNFFTPNFATEVEVGYLEADGKDAGIDTDLWGIPFLLNARVRIPVKALELYGGAGIGSIYYDISTSPGPDVDGWVAAADTFFGATITLKNSFVLGVEAKYFFTDSVSELHSGLDAYAVMLTLGFSR
jgi:hypothetical protein